MQPSRALYRWSQIKRGSKYRWDRRRGRIRWSYVCEPELRRSGLHRRIGLKRRKSIGRKAELIHLSGRQRVGPAESSDLGARAIRSAGAHRNVTAASIGHRPGGRTDRTSLLGKEIAGIVHHVHERESVFRRQIVVKMHDALVVVDGRARAGGICAARTVRQRQILGDVVGDYRIHRHLVVGVIGAGDWIHQLDGWQEFAEISAALGLVQYRDGCRRLPFAASGSLVRKEEESLVFLDRSSQRAAEYVAFERGSLGSESVAGVQVIVPDKFETVAVNRVGSGLGYLVNDSAGRASKFGVVVIDQNLELFHRVGVVGHHDVVTQKVGVVGSVQQEGQRLRALPAYREWVARRVVRIRGEHAGLQKSELQGIAG